MGFSSNRFHLQSNRACHPIIACWDSSLIAAKESVEIQLSAIPPVAEVFRVPFIQSFISVCCLGVRVCCLGFKELVSNTYNDLKETQNYIRNKRNNYDSR